MYRIYFLKTGTHTDSGNESETYTKKDLEEIRDSYDPKIFKAPIVIGHNEDIKALYENDKAPAYGWVETLGVDNKGLYADVSLVKEFEDILEREVPPYKYVSAAIYERDNSFNPTKGDKKYIRHIAFLGGTPPAIKGLPDVVRKYSESNVVNTMTLFNINNNKNNNVEKNMKKYMVEDFDSYQEVVTLPNPETATPEEIKDFLNSNSFDFLVYILTEGEYGYPGEITEFSPDPSEENNYLFDSNTNSFSGIFYDDTSGEVDGFKFEIKKSGEGWTSSYIPVNQVEETEEMDNFTEEEIKEEVPIEEGVISTEDESALALGEIPEDVDKEEELPESSDSEIELLRSETRNLRNEILKLKNELNEMKMEEYRAYAEKFTPILENSSINQNQLASLLYELDNTFSRRKLTKAYSEVIKEKPVDVLKKLLDNSLEKLTTTKVVTYGEFMPEEDESTYMEEETTPIGTVYSDEGLNTHKQVLEYCQKNNMDPKNISQYLEAYKAICR